MIHVVELTVSELGVARWLAAERQRANAIWRDSKVGPQSAEVTDIEGTAGELAFCKLFNLWPDITIGRRRGGADAEIRVGERAWKIDVKTTRFTHGNLLIYPGKVAAVEVDIYVLMVGQAGRYRCAGWSPAARATDPNSLQDLGYGPCYATPQSALIGPALLMEAEAFIPGGRAA